MMILDNFNKVHPSTQIKHKTVRADGWQTQPLIQMH
jgi:hypothetical protein